MFDNNVFIKNSFKKTVVDNKATGFELQTHITYYRAIPLSMVNDVRVTVDDQAMPRENILCSVDQVDWFTLDEMPTVTTYKWEYGEPLYIRVATETELAAGEHEVELAIVTRTAYIPVPIEGVRKRTVTV
ncbi:hypothetical protein BAU15_01255 [Enterococcus sp. JM4C]|uniref:C-glycoside deglycosidase beta subunit domain-containing protein n=1 Tax=Candidatus Enterococcus huntleyi TaxID=1857217 RepID=UPI001379AB4D|nr:DUF6379 domain-containing protein [Enterococcus sp. JM4C]KAF1299302.1 hypothetical protein BAU15_01255 [Enterococcus sp. JM4C]